MAFFWPVVSLLACLLGVVDLIVSMDAVFVALGPFLWALVIALSAYIASQLARRCIGPGSMLLGLIVFGLLFQVVAGGVVTYLGFFAVLSRASQLIVLGLAGLAISSRHQPWVIRSARLTYSGSARRPIVMPVFAVAMIVASGAITALNQVRYISSDADSMFYHFPMVAEWTRSGSIWPGSTLKLIARAYPGFKESVLTALTLPVGNEHLALPVLWEYALFVAVIYVLARHFGVSRWPATGLVCCAATMPIVATTTVTAANTDCLLATLLCMSVLFLSMFSRRPNGRLAMLAGLAVGAMAATKFSGVIYAGIVLSVAAIHVLVCRCTGPRSRQSGVRALRVRASHIGVFSLAALIVAGPWYLRNVFAFGNPLYPAEVSLGGMVIFSGSLTDEYFSGRTLGWDIKPLVANARHFVQAFGWLVPFVAFGVILLPVFTLARWRAARRLLPLVVLPFLLAIAFLHHPYNTPSSDFHYNMRYLMPVVFITFIAAGVVVSRARRLAAVMSIVLLALAALNLAAWTRHAWWIVAAAVAIVLGSVVSSAYRQRRPHIRFFPILWSRWMPLVTIPGLVLCGYTLQHVRSELQYHPGYGYPSRVDPPAWGTLCSYVHRNVHNSRVAIFGDGMFFPLYGDDLSNVVIPLGMEGEVEDVVEQCVKENAEYLVIFNSSSTRAEDLDVESGDSLGDELLRCYPNRHEDLVEHDGSHVLRLRIRQDGRSPMTQALD